MPYSLQAAARSVHAQAKFWTAQVPSLRPLNLQVTLGATRDVVLFNILTNDPGVAYSASVILSPIKIEPDWFLDYEWSEAFYEALEATSWAPGGRVRAEHWSRPKSRMGGRDIVFRGKADFRS